MFSHYHSTIRSYIAEGKLPIWVVYREAGLHPARLFHDHEYSELALIISGNARHILADENVPIEAGDLLVIHPGASHAYDETQNMEIINLIYDHARISLPILDGYSMPLFQFFFPAAGKQKNSAKPVAHLELSGLREVVRMIRTLDDELKNCRPGNLFYSLALFMEILVKISRMSGYRIPEQRVSFLIGDAVSYMNRHYAESIHVEELARIAHMSPRSFHRHFKKNVGSSPVDYLMRIRIQHASDLLINSNSSIGEIAARCGFYDSNYFCKQFREIQATTPRAFRLAYRKIISAQMHSKGILHP